MTNLPPPPPQYPPPPPGQWGPPPVPPPAPAGKVKIRGRIPLRLALIFGVVGVALCVVGIVVLVQSPLTKVDSFPRIALDGSPHVVQLTRTGEYVGYYETPGLDTSSNPPEGRLRISGPSGDLPFTSYGRRLTYEYGGHSGIAVVKFSIGQPGRYSFAGTSGGSTADLALGESIAKSLVVGVLLFLPGLLLVIAAIVLLIVGLVKRSRHKRELASVYVGGPGPNYYTGR